MIPIIDAHAMKGETIEIRAEQSSESTAELTLDTVSETLRPNTENDNDKDMNMRGRPTPGSGDGSMMNTHHGLPKTPRGRLPEVRMFHPAPIETRHRSMSPSLFVRCGSHDDSQRDGESGISTYASSVYLRSPRHSDAASYAPLPSPQDDAEEVMIHRYLAEKAKVRAAEAYNADLQMTVAALDKKLEESLNDAEKAKIASDTKAQQYEKLTQTLEQTIKDLQSQFSKHSIASGTQVSAIRQDADKQIKIIREIGESNVDSIRKEVEKIQITNVELEKLLSEKEAELSEQNRKVAETEKRYQDINEDSSQLKQDIKILQAELLVMKGVAERKKNASQSEIDDLRMANENVNEMLAFQDDKCRELSSELKYMSQHYIESMEKLQLKSCEAEKLISALDAAEKKLSEEKNNNASISIQLEDMARGYIDIDDQLEVETENIHEMTSIVEDLKETLESEKEKMSKLTDELSSAQKSFKLKSDEVLKLHDLTTDMSAQLSAEKSSLADALAEVINLTKALEETQVLLEDCEAELKFEKENNKKLERTLDELKEKYASVSKDFTSSAEGEAKVAGIAEELKDKSQAYALLESELAEAKRLSKESDSKSSKKIEILTSTISKLESDTSVLNEISASMEDELKNRKALCEELENELETNNNELSNLRAAYEEFKGEAEDRMMEQDEKNSNLSSELEILEKNHASLFDNLVETETALNTTKETLLLLNKKLDQKDDEFKPIEKALKEEIEKRKKSLKQEQEKSLTLSTELVDVSNKCNLMQSKVDAAEYRLKKMDIITQDLQHTLSEKENEYESLTKILEKERNAPHQRKLKEAKRMIQAEKDRHRAILQEVKAKNLIISRIEEQAAGLKCELHNTKEELEEEKSKKVTYAGLALQELRKQLEEERKSIKTEKEELRSMLKSEKAKSRSLTLRLKAMEAKSNDDEASEISRSLQKQFEDGEEIRKLSETNAKLEGAMEESKVVEDRLKGQLSRVMKEFKNISEAMDTMKKYCEGLEREKHILQTSLKKRLRSVKQMDDDSLDTGDEEISDAETVGDSEKSLSEFSVALTPPPRQTHRDFLGKRTSVLKMTKQSESPDIEMTVDTDILYD